MTSYYKVDEWSIIEERFNPAMQEASESIFSLGNGRMGQRANFEEAYSGESLQGNYVAGVYYPDKTRVGWWKNGYPEFFAKVLNAPNWIGIGIQIDGVILDLHKLKVLKFRRELNMRQGYLERVFTVRTEEGKEFEVKSRRFLSMADDEVAAIRYSVRPLHADAEISITPFIDGHVKNRDSNYDEVFWDIVDAQAEPGSAFLVSETRKSAFRVAFSMKYDIMLEGEILKPEAEVIMDGGYVGNRVTQTGSRRRGHHHL
jgi:maltose phosphorylase